MPKPIQIPDYDIIAPNNIWGKPDSIQYNGRDITGIRLLQAETYTIPTRTEVTDEIQRQTRLLVRAFSGEKIKASEAPLYDCLFCFPEKIITGILEGGSELQKLGECYSRGSWIEGDKHFASRTGFVSLEELDKVKDSLRNDASYCVFLQECGINYLFMRVLLDRAGGLLSKSKLEQHLKDEVLVSRHFEVNSMVYLPYADIARQLRFLKSVFNTPKKISSVFEDKKTSLISKVRYTLLSRMREVPEAMARYQTLDLVQKLVLVDKIAGFADIGGKASSEEGKVLVDILGPPSEN